MSRFDKLFEDISQRADSPEIVEFALTEMYKLLIKNIGEDDEKVQEGDRFVAVDDGSNVVRLRRINGTRDSLG